MYFTSEATINSVLISFSFRPDIHLGAVIQALKRRNVLQSLARAESSGYKRAKGEFPGWRGMFLSYSSKEPKTSAAVTIQFKPFGVRLDFTGTIGDDNVIRLHVLPK